MTRAKKLGILTGGGDVPGLNVAMKAVVERAHDEGWETIGIRRGWGGLLHCNLDSPHGAQEPVYPFEPKHRAHHRPQRRHLPAHLAHQSAAGQRIRGARFPAGHRCARRRRRQTRRSMTLPPHVLKVLRGPGDRRPGPDRRRRHPVLCRAAAQRRASRWWPSPRRWTTTCTAPTIASAFRRP